MLKQINAFDTTFLKKRVGIIVTEKVRAKVNVYHALIQAITPLKMTVAYIDGEGLELKDIRPAQLTDGTVKISLVIPFTPGVAAAETAATTSEEEEVNE